jgi:hypothetical protein
VRTAALLALCLAGCADGIAPWQPPVVINHTFRPGDRIVCTETLVRIGLPDTGMFQVIGFAKRTWTCELHRPTTQAEGGFRK